MRTSVDMERFELIYVIVNFGAGSKVLHIARDCGVSGGTILLGKGTVPGNFLLDFFELRDVRKEILLMITEKSIGEKALSAMQTKLKFHKPNHGIAFTMPLRVFLGSGDCEFDCDFQAGGAEDTMYHSIFTIVDKGRGELVMDAGYKVGAKGGTIINARGAGIHEKSTLFHMDIEPEKEVVLILSECHRTQTIVTAIRKDLAIDEPGNGVIFVQSVGQTYGIRR